MKLMPVTLKNSAAWSRLFAATACCVAVAAQAACRTDVGASATPSADFTVNANGTVVHAATGLMWKECNEGLSGDVCGTGAATHLTWADALTAAKISSFAGYTDWRLPNKQELESVVDDTCWSPSINSTVFPGTNTGETWTSTTMGGAYAWLVYFGAGDSIGSYETFGYHVVRLVRSGQSFDTMAAAPPILNIDDSDAATRYRPDTDGVLLLRYLFGLRGAALTAGALGSNPQRSSAQIEAHIAVNLAAFDVDGDTKVLATTDGLMILRRLLGLSGTALTAGAKNSARSDVDIAAAIDALKP